MSYDDNQFGTPASIRTDNTETLANALQRIKDLEAENKALKSKLETAEEALAGAHRVIRETRDKDSVLPGDPVDFGHVGQVAG